MVSAALSLAGRQQRGGFPTGWGKVRSSFAVCSLTVFPQRKPINVFRRSSSAPLVVPKLLAEVRKEIYR